MFLMPSKFEPCGLNQMYSLRYGTVPIVCAVGGLDDTVQNWDAVSQTGNGFKFRRFRATGCSKRSMRRDLRTRTKRPGRKFNAMECQSITRGKTLRGIMSSFISGH